MTKSLGLFTLLIFCCFVFLQSCKGQTTNKQKDSETVIKSESTDDKLFFLDGQLCAWVRDIFQDSRGNMWFATNHYGVMYHDGKKLHYFDENHGLGVGRVNCITEDQEGNVWLGTYNGLSQFLHNVKSESRKKFINYSWQDEAEDNEVWDIFIEENGKFWLGTTAGVYLFNKGDFLEFPIPKIAVPDTQSIVSYDRVTSIIKDRSGIYWYGRDGFGICQHSPRHSSFRHFTEANGLSNNSITDLMEDENGYVWIGSMHGGMSRYDPFNKGFTHFTQDGVIKGVETSGLHNDNKGRIWFSAENEGVFRYDTYATAVSSHDFKKFDKESGLQSLGILSIYEDREERLWLGGWGGLFRLDGEKFSMVTKDGPWN